MKYLWGHRLEARCSSNPFVTSELKGSGWSAKCPDLFTTGGDRIGIILEAWRFVAGLSQDYSTTGGDRIAIILEAWGLRGRSVAGLQYVT